jgi:acyl-[acyl-carrier-protein]-phospholipid O-acyltransferase/long-chain-fatty-acid--[acyl-carrier-protein] ligase
MVPHLGLESAIMELTGVDEQHVAVTGIPDPKHGERLCVLYTDVGMTPVEIHQKLTGGSIPRVWIPSQRDFFQVAEIPITPTGKVDLRRLKQIALEHAAGPNDPPRS